jgi:pyruvate/2-oxoglutarate dehydrogenase complex dihydrolipoamide dehydrogenase (E3) component
MDALIPGRDKDIVKVLEKRITKRYEKILLKTKVNKIEALKEGLKVTFDNAGREQHRHFRRNPDGGRPPSQRARDQG